MTNNLSNRPQTVSLVCPAGLPPATFEAIMSFDMSDVRMLMKDHEGIEDENLVLESELAWKQYLCLLFMNPGKKFAISAPVDVFGHTQMLDTREFGKFCRKIMQGKMNHKPTKSAAEREALLTQYQLETIPMLRNLFGGQINEAMWPQDHCVCLWDTSGGGTTKRGFRNVAAAA